MGARVYAIGNGTPEMARDFVEQFGVDFEVFTDPRRATYEAAGMLRWKTSLFELGRTLKHGVRGLKSGFRQGRTQGDPWQNGGVMVIDPEGSIVLAHAEREAGDLLDPERILHALRDVPPSARAS